MDKKVRIFLIALAISLYASLGYYTIGTVFLIYNDNAGTIGTIMFSVGFIVSLIALIICIILIVLSAKNIRRDQFEDMSLLVMVVKISLIPWFIANFVICACMTAGMLNPFLFIFIPLFITYSICITYLFIVATTFVNLGYIFAKVKKKALRMNKNIIVSIVFQFIECLDFIGAIILYKELNKTKAEEIENVQ